MRPAHHVTEPGWFVRRAARWRSVGRLLRHTHPALLTATIALHITVGLLPVVFIAWTSRLISRVPDALSPSGGSGWAVLGLAPLLAVCAFVVQQLLAPFQSALGELVTRQVDGACIARLMRCALIGLPVAELERQDVLDILSDARGGFERVSPTPGDAAAGALALIARYAQLTGASVMVALVLGPGPGALVAVTALVIRFGQRGSLDRFGALRIGLAGERRKLNYLRRTAGGPALAKEARMLGLLPWLRERHTAQARGYLDPLWEGRRRLLFWPFVGLAAVGLVGGGGSLYVLAREGASGSLSLLQLSVALQAVLIPMRFGVYFPESDVQIRDGLAAYHALTRLESMAAGGPAGPERQDGALATVPEGAIRFEDVTFRYQDDGPDVLSGLDLVLEHGRSTAVVGLNGAGKTTLVKLLARLHEPSGGRITAGGTPLSGVSAADWHRRIAVIFQDFTRYQLTAAENIGLGRPDRMDDREALLAAARRAGAREVIERLPNGLDTVLSGQYENGSDLSGGQWQRVALSRALLAVDAGASLLILDEPTAQLDVRAEAAFFDRFLEMTEGITSVIVAHRFSSVRRADRIVVLADGAVAESGTHEELMALDGRYAELFRIQAERFAEEQAEDAAVRTTAGTHARAAQPVPTPEGAR
ncbi:ABC transporter ATP-binding protein [Streptomyces sp. NPDC050255]|uniref:ABC transporter ATP-binding protein n=1 Tax=Streptomyces sp. NPDC050255 TaxID=3365606 RepID=UPI0037B98CDB